MGKLMQYIAMLSGSSWVLITGMNLGWASPYLPILESDHSPIGRISPDDAFWCSVIPLVGAIPGALAAGAIVDKFGRKTILVSLSPVCFACFMAMAFTTKLWVLDAARFLIGTMEGATYTVLPMYYGEIAEASIRGTMSSSILAADTLGLLIINVIGPWMTIYTSSLIMAAIPLIHFCTFIWMPKSPYHLLKIGQVAEAKHNLRRLRGEQDINEEFDLIAAAVKRQEADAASVSFRDLFTQRGNRKAIAIFLIMAMSNKFSGSNPVMFYTQTIFAQADGILDPATSVIIFHVAGFASNLVASYTMDKFGRRPLTLFSVIGCGFSLAAMATYFTLQNLNMDDLVNQLNWLPLAALISYYSIFNLGICLGPVVFLSELFPTSVKGYALGLADASSGTMGTISSKIFHALSISYGMHVPFWLFATVCVLCAVLIYVFVPETKGKTLEEIQLELVGKADGPAPARE